MRRAGDDDFRGNAAAHAMANHVIRRQAERIDQRHDVLDHVAEAEGGVHRQRLGIAVAAHVGGDGPEAGGKSQHGLLPEGGGSAVAVNEKHGGPAGRSARKHVHGQAWRPDHLGGDPRQGGN